MATNPHSETPPKSRVQARSHSRADALFPWWDWQRGRAGALVALLDWITIIHSYRPPICCGQAPFHSRCPSLGEIGLERGRDRSLWPRIRLRSYIHTDSQSVACEHAPTPMPLRVGRLAPPLLATPVVLQQRRPNGGCSRGILSYFNRVGSCVASAVARPQRGSDIRLGLVPGRSVSAVRRKP